MPKRAGSPGHFTLTEHCLAPHFRRAAIEPYAACKTSFTPGTRETQTSGRPHQISRAMARTASAPPECEPSLMSKRSSWRSSRRDMPSNAPTRGSCSGATPIPRRRRMGVSQRAVRVQKPHSASKKSHPRALRSYLSVNSLARVIMFLSPGASRRGTFLHLA